jgi:tetratricopeptide (TPR) repeat protein
MCDHY